MDREPNLLNWIEPTSAILSFSYRTTNNLNAANDCVSIRVSNNGGGSYTNLQTFCGIVAGAVSYDITAYIASNTRIRLIVTSSLEANEYFYVDNIKIGDGGLPISGHWEFRTNMSGSARR